MKRLFVVLICVVSVSAADQEMKTLGESPWKQGHNSLFCRHAADEAHCAYCRWNEGFRFDFKIGNIAWSKENNAYFTKNFETGEVLQIDLARARIEFLAEILESNTGTERENSITLSSETLAAFRASLVEPEPEIWEDNLSVLPEGKFTVPRPKPYYSSIEHARQELRRRLVPKFGFHGNRLVEAAPSPALVSTGALNTKKYNAVGGPPSFKFSGMHRGWYVINASHLVKGSPAVEVLMGDLSNVIVTETISHVAHEKTTGKPLLYSDGSAKMRVVKFLYWIGSDKIWIQELDITPRFLD